MNSIEKLEFLTVAQSLLSQTISTEKSSLIETGTEIAVYRFSLATGSTNDIELEAKMSMITWGGNGRKDKMGEIVKGMKISPMKEIGCKQCYGTASEFKFVVAHMFILILFVVVNVFY